MVASLDGFVFVETRVFKSLLDGGVEVVHTLDQNSHKDDGSYIGPELQIKRARSLNEQINQSIDGGACKNRTNEYPGPHAADGLRLFFGRIRLD